MSKKAPDTRNRLDNNRNSKVKAPKKKPTVITQQQLKEIVKEQTPGVVKLKMEKRPTKGQLFKQTHGYSKTKKRLLHKHNLTGEHGLGLLKEKTKIRKLKEKKVRQDKRATSTTFKRLNGGKNRVKTQGKKKKAVPTK